jgi:hypothetical protein
MPNCRFGISVTSDFADATGIIKHVSYDFSKLVGYEVVMSQNIFDGFIGKWPYQLSAGTCKQSEMRLKCEGSPYEKFDATFREGVSLSLSRTFK